MIKYFLLFSFIFLVIFVLNNPVTTGNLIKNFVNINYENASNLLDDFVVIDIRTPEEYNSGKIGNAINIDFYSNDFKKRLSELDRDKKYLVYCRTGSRSSQALKIFDELNFTQIYHLNKGIVSWNYDLN